MALMEEFQSRPLGSSGCVLPSSSWREDLEDDQGQFGHGIVGMPGLSIARWIAIVCRGGDHLGLKMRNFLLLDRGLRACFWTSALEQATYTFHNTIKKSHCPQSTNNNTYYTSYNHSLQSKMAFFLPSLGLGNMFYGTKHPSPFPTNTKTNPRKAIVLLSNGLAVLSEDRFLARSKSLNPLQ